jgi:hypothetical protein
MAAFSLVHNQLRSNPNVNTGYSGYGSHSLVDSEREAVRQRADAFHRIRSRFNELKNPYDDKYENGLINRQRGGVQREYSNNLGNIRSAMADRGLSQGGVSGFEQQAVIQNELARTGTLGALNAEAATQTADKSAQFEQSRTAALDNFELAQASGTVQAGQAAFDQMARLARQPYELEGMSLQNQGMSQSIQHASQMNPLLVRGQQQQLDFDATYNPLRIKGAEADLTGKGISNATDAQNLQILQQTAPELVQAKLSEYRQAQAEGRLNQWMAENAHWLGPIKFLANAGVGVAQAVAGGAAGR